MTKQELKKCITITIIIAAAYLVVNNIPDIINIFKTIIGVLMPFIIGGVIAYILNIPMTKIETLLSKKIKKKSVVRTISITLSLLVFVAIIAIILLLLIPELVQSIESLVSSVPALLNNVQSWALDLLDQYPELQTELAKAFQETTGVKDILTTILNYIIDGSVGFVSSLVSSVVTIFMALVFAIYMLSQKESLLRGCKKVLYAIVKKEQADKVMEVLNLTNKTFYKFISGQCLEACILGVLMFAAVALCGFPYALIIGVLTAVTALVPIFGAIAAMVIGAILIAMTSPWKALLFIVVFQVIQQIEGNLIYPKVVGKSVGLSPLWTLLAITVGGNLFGIMGMLVSLPVASVLYALLKENVHVKLKDKKIEVA